MFPQIRLATEGLAAFSRGSRNRILEEADHQCKKQSDECSGGLEAAHVSHKKDEFYDKTWNGEALCSYHHLEDHIERHGRNGLPKKQNEWAIRQISQRL